MIGLLFVTGLVVGWAAAILTEQLPAWGLLPRKAGDVPPLPTDSITVRAWPVAWFMGAVMVALYLIYGSTAQMGTVAVAAVYFTTIALIDLRYRYVLNIFVYPALVLVILLHTLSGTPPASFLMGGLFALVIFYGTATLSPGSLGMGDVKLAVLIGLILGFPGVLVGLLIGTGAGGVVAVGLLLRRHSRHLTIPYAPCLCLGVMVTLIVDPFIPVIL